MQYISCNSKNLYFQLGLFRIDTDIFFKNAIAHSARPVQTLNETKKIDAFALP